MQQPSSPTTIAIIGAGIAGASCAYLLQLFHPNLLIYVIDSSAAPASGASGNEVGLLYPRIESQYSPAMRFYARAWHIAKLHYTQLQIATKTTLISPCGIVQLPKNEADLKRFDKIIQQNTIEHLAMSAKIISGPNIESECGVKINADHALLLPELPLVYPRKICNALLNNEHIRKLFDFSVTSIEKRTSCSNSAALTNRRWQLQIKRTTKTGASPSEVTNLDTETTASLLADAIIIANSSGATQIDLPTSAHWHDIQRSLTAVRGQIEHLHSPGEASNLRRAICGSGGYITPNLQHFDASIPYTHVVGATYDYNNLDLSINSQDSHTNIENFDNIIKNESEKTNIVFSRAALRCVTRTRLPVYGELSDAPGIFYSLAHGSRGLLSGIAIADELRVMLAHRLAQ